ncbi:MAG: class I SAM-dependent methyltransferase [Fermentimonas sp.]|jgi:SAM-dependent methyltransferase
MQKRHTDRKQYFKELVQTSEKYILPFIENHMQVGSNLIVLEVGCGEGGNLVPFSRRGCGVIGVDISVDRIEEARGFFSEEQLEGEFLCQDIITAELTGKFDIIIIRDVIEHVREKGRLLATVSALLNDNGLIFIAFPPWQMPFGGHQQICRNRVVSSLPFIHLLPRKTYEALLKKTGVDKHAIEELLGIRDCRMTIEHFKKLIRESDLKQIDEVYYFINPHYDVKFGLKPCKVIFPFFALPVCRNYYTTSYFVILKKRD